MNTIGKTTGYEGETYESLKGQLDYCNLALSNDLEKWERKEYEEVKSDLEYKIEEIRISSFELYGTII